VVEKWETLSLLALVRVVEEQVFPVLDPVVVALTDRAVALEHRPELLQLNQTKTKVRADGPVAVAADQDQKGANNAYSKEKRRKRKEVPLYQSR
jgi:hypothetical protein